MDKRPILFLHFHKAGGTTMGKLFEGVRKKYPINRNGNPFSKKGIIPLWTFKRQRLNRFAARLSKLGVGYVAVEWNFFIHHRTISWKPFHFLTTLRDPYERFISNMNVHHAKNALAYMRRHVHISRRGKKIPVSFNRPNFYVRMLNGLGTRPKASVNRSHLEHAKKVLSRFDTICILENKPSFKALDKLGVKKNPSNVKRNVWRKKKRYYIQRKAFEELNQLDMELYSFAKELVETRMKASSS